MPSPDWHPASPVPPPVDPRTKARPPPLEPLTSRVLANIRHRQCLHLLGGFFAGLGGFLDNYLLVSHLLPYRQQCFIFSQLRFTKRAHCFSECLVRLVYIQHLFKNLDYSASQPSIDRSHTPESPQPALSDAYHHHNMTSSHRPQ